ARSSRARIRSADRSSARVSRKMPFSGWARPMGVRADSMMTAWRMGMPSVVQSGKDRNLLAVGRAAAQRIGAAVGARAGLDGLLLVNRKRGSDRPGPPTADARDRETIHGTTRLRSGSRGPCPHCRPDPAPPTRTDYLLYSSRPGENLNAP